MLITRNLLRRLLGLIWFIDGLLQIQPQMWTMNMVNGIMKPMLQGQPAPVERNLQWIIQITTDHLVLVNLLICAVQILGGLILLSARAERLIKGTLVASVVWVLAVWYGGEGMSMLLTGQASAFTGAPGAVLLYGLLALAVYPASSAVDPESGILSRLQVRWVLGLFWVGMAALQAQPYWWEPGQISGVFGGDIGMGGLNGAFIDPLMRSLAQSTASLEIPLNIAAIVLFLAIGIPLLMVTDTHVRPVLMASVIVSLGIWVFFEAFGMVLTGMATDFNSGLPLVLVALACWPRMHRGAGAWRPHSGEEAPRAATAGGGAR
jgi:hypothetical protein